jgi:hypothetical protein
MTARVMPPGIRVGERLTVVAGRVVHFLIAANVCSRFCSRLRAPLMVKPNFAATSAVV